MSSLLEEAMEEFTILDKKTQSDGYGGIKTDYVDGATFLGALVFNSSTQMIIAQSQGVTSAYTLTTNKNIILEYHNIIRRTKDNKIFRVTSDGDDKFTPNSASLNMRQVTCEEYSLS